MEFFYMMAIGFPVIFAALGAGIGQGLIGLKALEAMNIQPEASKEINRIALIGMSLTETSAILGLVISIFLLFDVSTPISYYYASFGKIGIGFAIGLTSLVAGIASSLPAQAACIAVSRQPFFSSKIFQLMLLTQSVIVTPNIFGFLIALFIQAKTPFVYNLNGGLQLLSAGVAIGIGSIGPCIGVGTFAYAACNAAGTSRKSYNKILPFTFLCEAIIETPVIFALLVALVILNATIVPGDSCLQGIAFLSAALAISLSGVGTGISAGSIAATTCDHIGKNPAIYPVISKVGLLALAMIDTFAIYGFIVAIILIYAI